MSTTAFAPPDRELVLDRYRPLRPIGRGGSGSVWLARDERTGLDVALKIVPREGKRAARAAREMEAASRLRHERCVRAYDFGEDDGHVYIAYEYVQGSTLRELLRTGKVTDEDAVEIVAQVLEALAHAHRRGIVHRDVKPSNVVVEDGPAVSARLLDFGLAQLDDTDTLTAVGDVPGTLAYIAPERLRGGEATTRTDVWAAGVMLWEALAGEHPFWGVPLPQVATAIEAGPASLGARRSDLPRRLLGLIGQALSLDPAARPEASHLAVELRQAFAPVEPRPARRVRASRPHPKGEQRTVVATVAPGILAVQAVATAVVTAVGATLLPFWTPGLVVLLALSAASLSVRAPRAGLALVLFAPLFPLGNVASGAAYVWGAVAVAWLALSWRRPRAGLAFATGPALGAIGLIAVLPLACQVVRAPARRALHVMAGVAAAVLVAALTGSGLPLTGSTVGNLGIAGSERMSDILNAILMVARGNVSIVVGGLALAATSVLLPEARVRGRYGIAALMLFQMTCLVVLAPAVRWPGAMIGTALLGGLLYAPAARRWLLARR